MFVQVVTGIVFAAVYVGHSFATASNTPTCIVSSCDAGYESFCGTYTPTSAEHPLSLANNESQWYMFYAVEVGPFAGWFIANHSKEYYKQHFGDNDTEQIETIPGGHLLMSAGNEYPTGPKAVLMSDGSGDDPAVTVECLHMPQPPPALDCIRDQEADSSNSCSNDGDFLNSCTITHCPDRYSNYCGTFESVYMLPGSYEMKNPVSGWSFFLATGREPQHSIPENTTWYSDLVSSWVLSNISREDYLVDNSLSGVGLPNDFNWTSGKQPYSSDVATYSPDRQLVRQALWVNRNGTCVQRLPPTQISFSDAPAHQVVLTVECRCASMSTVALKSSTAISPTGSTGPNTASGLRTSHGLVGVLLLLYSLQS